MNRKGGAFRLWFAIFVFLGFMTWMAVLGLPTGLDTPSDPSAVAGINESEDPGVFESAYNFYDYTTSLVSEYTAVTLMVVVPISLIGLYGLIRVIRGGG